MKRSLLAQVDDLQEQVEDAESAKNNISRKVRTIEEELNEVS